MSTVPVWGPNTVEYRFGGAAAALTAPPSLQSSAIDDRATLRSRLMAKRKRRQRREPAPSVDYTDPEGNVLTLRAELSAKTIAKIGEDPASRAASTDDAWRRREEMRFERLAVRWEIAGLPLTDQAMLLGRYRMADAETQRWVRETIAAHLERCFPGQFGP